jgi:hypothetical protein
MVRLDLLAVAENQRVFCSAVIAEAEIFRTFAPRALLAVVKIWLASRGISAGRFRN